MADSAIKPGLKENPSKNRMAKSTEEVPLRRALNLAQTTFLGVGTAICGTMFAIMGKAIGAAGPSIAITFLIGDLFALFDEFSYAALGYNVTAITVAFSLIRLRRTEPHLYRPFKVPLYPYPTVLAILTSILMILTLSRLAYSRIVLRVRRSQLTYACQKDAKTKTCGR